MKTDRRGFLRGLGAALLATTIPAPLAQGSIFEATHPLWKAQPLPSGWIPCDGRMLSRRMFPELFKVIGEHYGKMTGDLFPIPRDPYFAAPDPDWFGPSDMAPAFAFETVIWTGGAAPSGHHIPAGVIMHRIKKSPV